MKDEGPDMLTEEDSTDQEVEPGQLEHDTQRVPPAMRLLLWYRWGSEELTIRDLRRRPTGKRPSAWDLVTLRMTAMAGRKAQQLAQDTEII